MANREMKNSGIPWIGNIPKNWDVCFIKQILRNKSIKGYPNEMVLSLYRDYGVIPKDSRSDNHNVTSEDTSSYKFVEVGDFVINKMKAWQGSMAVSDYQGIISPAYYICRFITNEIDRKYIHYLLRNDTYKAEYMRLSSGMRIGQWDLNIDDFLRIKMVLPSLSEQQQIASFLDRKCAEIDEMIALQEKIIEELKEYKQSVITEAVTKGLNPDVPMKDSGIEWIGEIPVHWEVTKLNYFLSKVGSGSTPTGGSSVYTNQGVKFLRSQNVYFEGLRLDDIVYITDDIDESMKGTRVLEGDVLLNITGGSIGRCFYVDSTLGRANVNQHVSILRPKTAHTRYLKYFLQSEVGQHQVQLYQTGGNREGLSAAAIKEFRFFNIPASEQQTISKFLDTKCTEIDNLISIKLSKIDSLKEYKKSIIYEYVTGKKEVTE